MDPTIRDGGPADAEAVARLLTQLGYPSDATAVEERLERLQVVGDRVVVAELEGEVVGLAHLQVTPAIERDRPPGKIGALVVDEAPPGPGLRRALLPALHAQARPPG